jgi:hypothetical protein
MVLGPSRGDQEQRKIRECFSGGYPIATLSMFGKAKDHNARERAPMTLIARQLGESAFCTKQTRVTFSPPLEHAAA